MSRTMTSLPREDGYRMPAEWEPHAQTWMLWPIRTDTWRNGAKPAQAAFVAVAQAIAQFEPVTIGVPAEQYRNARAMLPPKIRVIELSANDAWMRDIGPTFVVNDEGSVRGIDWSFNAWGGLKEGAYFPWDQDSLVAQKVLEMERCTRYASTITTEGGALHVDGEGTLLATRTSIINPNRNPGYSQNRLEVRLKHYLNVEKVIWIEQGVYKDETDGHIDNLCCFVRPGVVALTWTDDESDPQYALSRAAYETLSQAQDAKGRSLEIHKIQQPGPLYMTEEEALGVDQVDFARLRQAGDRLAASYINFYIANGGVIFPTFDDPQDQAAQAKLEELFPDHTVIGVPGREIVLGGGNIHCITQQQPAGTG